MTTDRPYRKGRSTEEALAVLREHAGRQFDAKVVTALEEVLQSL
jgi:putative two-component system response regulator